MNSFQLRLRALAELELENIISWYNSKNPILGKRLALHFSETADFLRRNPFIYQIVYKDFRRALLRSFPVGVFYRIYGDVVTVYSVMDLRRDPGKVFKKLLI